MSIASDPHDLQRFADAQAPVYDQVLTELRAGRKTSHWIWFVFPQLKCLGRSGTARHFGIGSIDEASAYWRHPLLGARLAQCTDIICALPLGLSAHEVFGSPDDLKLRSCLTLFAQVAPEAQDSKAPFERALRRYFDGVPDARTLELLT